jgi:hypothetical protein
MTQKSQRSELCSIPGCHRKKHSRGWCNTHYQRWRINGTTELAPRVIKTCLVEGCEEINHSKAMCSLHFQRWRTHGDPLKTLVERAASPEEAIQVRTQRRGSCLIWTGSKTAAGYGNMNWGGEVIYVHRYVWERTNGPIPNGKWIDHICHNRSCANIKHLRLATPAQNCSHLRGPSSHNRSSGVRNVYPRGERWYVLISKDNEPHNFGTYDTLEEAAEVAERARRELFGEFAGKG